VVYIYFKIFGKIYGVYISKINSIKYPGCTVDGKYHLPLHIESEFYSHFTDIFVVFLQPIQMISLNNLQLCSFYALQISLVEMQIDIFFL
jgi:hypothetical protein